MRLPSPPRHRAFVAALFPLAVLALLAAGCGGSGGGSPTDPGMPPPAAGSASIQGQVTAPGSTTGGLTAGGQEPTPVRR